MLRRISPVVVLVCLLAVPSAANALATRTWVSGTGDDVNPCSRTAPCKTFAGAITKTAAGGEIDALDPGGYGAVTITKAITIDGGSGQVGGVLVSGTNGINVSAPGAQVILRNLDINGSASDNPSPAGLNGIDFTSGASLQLQNDQIFGFGQNGVSDTAPNSSLVVSASTISNGGGNGVNVAAPGGSSATALLENSDVENNAGNGVLANGSGSTVYLSGASVFGNGTGLSAINGGSIVAVGPNNFVYGNGSNGNATSTVGAGAQGPPGAPGAPGSPAGAAGQPGKVVLVSCKTITKKVKVRGKHGKKKTVTRKLKKCTARAITGTVTFTTT
jgi:hypothetical protein